VQAFHLLEYLSRVAAGGGTAVGAALQDYALRTHAPGLAIVISDLLGSPGWQRGIAALRYRRFDVVLVQVLDQEESRRRIGPSRLGTARPGVPCGSPSSWCYVTASGSRPSTVVESSACAGRRSRAGTLFPETWSRYSAGRAPARAEVGTP
jgi:hypothetical protein